MEMGNAARDDRWCSSSASVACRRRRQLWRYALHDGQKLLHADNAQGAEDGLALEDTQIVIAADEVVHLGAEGTGKHLDVFGVADRHRELSEGDGLFGHGQGIEDAADSLRRETITLKFWPYQDAGDFVAQRLGGYHAEDPAEPGLQEEGG